MTRLKTTAEMDGWEGDPNDPDRWKTWYQCNSCGDWTLFQSDKEHHGALLPGQKCSHCGGTQFNPQSATSKRTFNEDRAKRAAAKKRSELKKKGQLK